MRFSLAVAQGHSGNEASDRNKDRFLSLLDSRKGHTGRSKCKTETDRGQDRESVHVTVKVSTRVSTSSGETTARHCVFGVTCVCWQFQK